MINNMEEYMTLDPKVLSTFTPEIVPVHSFYVGLPYSIHAYYSSYVLDGPIVVPRKDDLLIEIALALCKMPFCLNTDELFYVRNILNITPQYAARIVGVDENTYRLCEYGQIKMSAIQNRIFKYTIFCKILKPGQPAYDIFGLMPIKRHYTQRPKVLCMIDDNEKWHVSLQMEIA